MIYKEINYKNFGKCLEINNGTVEITVTLDIGPRIIKYALLGGENVFFEDTERKIFNDCKEIKDYYGQDAVWYIYGGHRLWISPEEGSTYFPDNSPVSYKADGGTFTFFGNLQKTGLKGEISLTLKENSSRVTVSHKVENRGNEAKRFAVWALSVLAPGGTEVVPFNDNKTGWLSNRTLMLWDYTEMDDERISFGKRYVLLRQDKNKDNAFKIGMDNKKGRAAYLNRNTAFIKRFSFVEGESYPDNGCNFETYTNRHMLECETLGPLKTVEPQGSVTHIEEWELLPFEFNKVAFDDCLGESIEKLLIGI